MVLRQKRAADTIQRDRRNRIKSDAIALEPVNLVAAIKGETVSVPSPGA